VSASADNFTSGVRVETLFEALDSTRPGRGSSDLCAGLSRPFEGRDVESPDCTRIEPIVGKERELPGERREAHPWMASTAP
jgi:hypothetical protein